jgi:DNA-binding IclR family transcriptional regulator
MESALNESVVKASRSPYKVQVLDRAVAILDTLSQAESLMTLVELSECLKLHKSTTHRILMVLERHRLVEKDPENRKYRLGLKLFELGNMAPAQIDLREQARPFLKRLVAETGETAQLRVLDEGEARFVDLVQSNQAIRISVGGRFPAHCCAVGKAMLAFQPEELVDEIIERQGMKACTRNTITSRSRLNAELQLVRELGYALDNEESTEGIKCLAAPIRDFTGEVIAAIGISGMASRLSEDRIPRLADAVSRAATELSRRLGWRAGPSLPAERT